MKSNTLEFWEKVQTQYTNCFWPGGIYLCNRSPSFKRAWGREKKNIRTKARQFLESDYRCKDSISKDPKFLFDSNFGSKTTRLKFLQWVINDLKNEQNILHRKQSDSV